MMEIKPAYITIVEGPPPEFEEVSNRWPAGVLEGENSTQMAMVEMRTFDGPKLLKRCQDAWLAGRDARFNYPAGDGSRGEIDIVAARWQKVEEGHKLYLWVRLNAELEINENPMTFI